MNEEEIEAMMEEAGENPNGRTVSTLRTGEHDGLAATVNIERWLEVGTDDEGGVLATPMIRIDVVYDGFEKITAFPFEGPAAEVAALADWALGDMVDGGYHETVMLERLDQTDVDLTREEFVVAARAVMADASGLLNVELGG